MSFQFRYQRILDVRELEEDQEQAEFVEIQNRLQREREKLETLRDKLEEVFDKARRGRSGSTNVDRINQYRDYIQQLKQKISDQKSVVESWENKLEKQRENLVEASQKRQVLEALKERDFEEFQEEVRERERQEQDNIANQQYYRQQDES